MQGGVGRHTQQSARAYTTIGQGAIKLKAVLESMDGGVLLDWALGVSTVTAITGGAQHVFHTGLSGTLLPSATIQAVKVENDGTEVVETYSGCTATKVAIEQPDNDEATIEVEADAMSYTTATAAASVSYASGPTIFDHYQGSVGFGGTLTVPTTTALASGLTAFADWRNWKLEIDQKANTSRWVAGARHQPLAGRPEIKFSGEIEHNATTYTAAYTAGTVMPWYWTWTTTEVLGAGVVKAQLVLPALQLMKGLPASKPGDVSVQEVDAMVDWDGTNEDMYLVLQTTDTAL